MKFDSSLITKLRSLSSRKGSISRKLISPSREWGTSLLVTTLVALALFGLAAFDFYEQFTDRAMPEVSEENIPKYRAQDAEFLIRYHEGRREVFDSLREDKPYIPPPADSGSEANAVEGGVVAGAQMEE